MTPAEIKALAINASQTYYNYLEGKGTEVCRLISINEKLTINPEHKIFKLSHLSERIYEIDAIFFWDQTTDKKYDTTQVKIVEYDIEQNFIIVQVSKDINLDLDKLRANEIIIFSDLKFLVQRVIDWYQKKQGEICIPSNSPSLTQTPQYFNDKEPNEQQEAAIQTILNNPLSYIWGAPGTGKTTIVLSYPIIQYVKAGKKVAILAPTNNALEQALSGIIEMTDRANIDRKQIIRLGNPSKSFAENYPQVCEAKGIMKKIQEIEEQIQLVKKTLEVEESINHLAILEDSLTEFDTINKLEIEREEFKEESKRLERELSVCNSDFKLKQSETQLVLNEIDRVEKVKNSFIYKLKRVFSNKSLQSQEEILLESLVVKHKQTNEALRISGERLNSIEYKKNEILNSYNDLSKINIVFNRIKDSLRINAECSNIASNINLDNYRIKRKELIEAISKFQRDVQINLVIASEYKHLSHSERVQFIKSLEDKKNELQAQTTEERLKGVNIVACTLDCYIGRFLEADLNVDHFFLDEAGYACANKALTLFRNNIPITFLGDHMQLPPVCQLNESDINTEPYKDVFVWAQSAIYCEGLFLQSKEEALNAFVNLSKPLFRQTSRNDLLVTRRFGSNLSHVLDQYVYRNNFTAADQNGSTQIYFAHVNNDIPPSRSRENFREAEMIRRIVSLGRINLNNAIILTPYVNQMNLIGSLLPHLRRNFQILTVHRSQGREWDTVIMSVSDTDNMFLVNAQILKSLCLINTAVSRAKRELIIVCNHSFWSRQNNQLITGLVNVAQPYPLN